jgi:hypothetical protein
MRIKETKVFQFDELNDEAKETARAWYRNASAGDDSFAEFILDDATDVLKVLGYSSVEIYYSGFCSQGDGAQFVGKFYASDYDAKGTNGVQKLLVDRPTDKELARCAAELERILLISPQLSASIKSSGHCSHEMATHFSVDFGDEEGTEPFDTDEIEDAFKEVSRDLMRWLYRSLEKNWDYQNSDECVDENIRANEYEFDKDGNRA